MGRTLFARVRAAYSSSPHTLNPFDELRKQSREDEEKYLQLIMERLPIMESDLLGVIQDLEKDEGVILTLGRLEEKLQLLAKKNYIQKEDTFLGYRYTKV
jgi:hypothetical protein